MKLLLTHITHQATHQAMTQAAQVSQLVASQEATLAAMVAVHQEDTDGDAHTMPKIWLTNHKSLKQFNKREKLPRYTIRKLT
jgi:hypothetical protein